MSRELHDGVIQTVIGLEMEIEAMRRKVSSDDPVAGRLKHVQELLHEEAVTLRELMQQMKPLDLRNSDFVAFVATTVDRFGRDSGIASASPRDSTSWRCRRASAASSGASFRRRSSTSAATAPPATSSSGCGFMAAS